MQKINMENSYDRFPLDYSRWPILVIKIGHRPITKGNIIRKSTLASFFSEKVQVNRVKESAAGDEWSQCVLK